MAGESEYTIDDLARAAETTVRSIRVYHERGLLPSPEVRGRIGYYRPDHLQRLQTISRLLGRGMRLNGIRELFDAWDRGDGLEVVLGVGGMKPLAEQPKPEEAEREHRALSPEQPAAPVAWTSSPWSTELADRLTVAGVADSDARQLVDQLASDCEWLTVRHANVLLRMLIGADYGRVPQTTTERVQLETNLTTARVVVSHAATELIEKAIQRYCDELSGGPALAPGDLPPLESPPPTG